MASKRRILVVEDDSSNIQSARDAFPQDQFDLTVLATCSEVLNLLSSASHRKNSSVADKGQTFDVILTDLNVPVGNLGTYDAADYCRVDDSIPIGLVVALAAIDDQTPCAILTDSNGHQDVMGLMIEQILGAYVCAGQMEGEMRKIAVLLRTRGCSPKDWRRALEFLDNNVPC